MAWRRAADDERLDRSAHQMEAGIAGQFGHVFFVGQFRLVGFPGAPRPSQTSLIRGPLAGDWRTYAQAAELLGISPRPSWELIEGLNAEGRAPWATLLENVTGLMERKGAIATIREGYGRRSAQIFR
jgi:hypothetical protein